MTDDEIREQLDNFTDENGDLGWNDQIRAVRAILEAARATPADHSAIVRMLEGYAESYEMMARQEKDATVRCSSVAVDIRQNMAKWVRDRSGPADHIVDANKKVDADSVPLAIYQSRAKDHLCYGTAWQDVDKDEYEAVGRTSNYERRIVYTAPQPEAQSVRDAVIEECVAAIRKAEFSKQDDEYMTGMEAVAVIRTLKSAPPQKPVSDEVMP